jgi:hypothetical protein
MAAGPWPALSAGGQAEREQAIVGGADVQAALV